METDWSMRVARSGPDIHADEPSARRGPRVWDRFPGSDEARRRQAADPSQIGEEA